MSKLLTWSELSTFKRCRRKWWLAHYRRLKPKREAPTGARQLGDRVHRALARYYTPGRDEDPRDALEDVLKHDWDELVAGIQDEAELASVATEWQKDADLARAMVEGYVDWLADTGADAELEVTAAEQALTVQYEEGITLAGRLDARAIDHRNDSRVFIDHKTVGSIADGQRMLHMDEQMQLYRYLEWCDSLSQRVEGALYNMLRKVKRTARANPPFYERVLIKHNDHELAAFQHHLRTMIRDVMVLEAELALADPEHHAHVAYPRPTRDCTWDCDYFPICPMFDDGSRVEDFIVEHYVEAPTRYPEVSE